MTDDRERAAHRAALDHVLTLVVGQPWSDMLVLRGSRLLRAWAGDLAREPADLRKGFDGLSHLVQSVLQEDPLSGHLFVFRNRWNPASIRPSFVSLHPRA